MLSALKELVSPEIRLPLTEKANGEKLLTIKETGIKSKVKKLIVSGLGDENFAFSLDYKPSKKTERRCFKQLSPYLNISHNAINKGCDLVLFSKFKSKWYVLILDLKSDKPRLKKTHIQLKNSELYIRYLCSLFSIHSPKTETPCLNYQKTYTTTRLSKGRVYHGRTKNREYLSVSVFVNRQGEANIHLGKLLGL